MPFHVPSLVNCAALYDGFVTEDLGHPRGERLGAVDDHDQPGAGLQAPGDEVREQGRHDRFVLGVPEPEPDGDLGAIGCHDQGRHTALAGHLGAIDHHDGHVQARKVPGHQLG